MLAINSSDDDDDCLASDVVAVSCVRYITSFDGTELLCERCRLIIEESI